MAERWQLAGSDAELDVWPEGAHAFAKHGHPTWRASTRSATSWITAILDTVDAQPAPAYAE
jgi:hypothetical protein